MSTKQASTNWWGEIERILFLLSIASMVTFIVLFFAATGNTFVQELSIQLFSVSLLFTLSQVFLKNFRSMRAVEETEALAKRIAELVNNQANLIRTVIDAGIMETCEAMPLVELKVRMSNAKQCVRIMHTFIDDPRQYKEAFVSATRNGSRIQLLFLNPDSQYARQRSRDVWPKNSLTPPDEQFVSKQITYSIDVLHAMVVEHGIKNLEVRLFDSLPSLALYVTDDQILLGFFLSGTKTDSATMLTVSGTTFFTRDLLGEFENRWASAKSVIST